MKIEDSNSETIQDIQKITALQSVDIRHNLLDINLIGGFLSFHR